MALQRARAARSAPAGGRPAVSICAPIRRSGTATRSIGRRMSERRRSASSRSAARPAAPSSGASRCRRCPCRAAPARRAVRRAPTPCTRTSRAAESLDAHARAPRARRAVARQSSPARKPLMCVVPWRCAPSISARCEIDLSPGTRQRAGDAAAGVDAIARRPWVRSLHRPRIGTEHAEQRGALLERRERVGDVLILARGLRSR